MPRSHPLFILFMVALTASGCSENDSEYSFQIDHSGSYTFSTARYEYECNDGTRGLRPGNEFLVHIYQIDNQIWIEHTTEPTIQGAEIIEETPMTGIVEINGSFETNRNLIARLEGVPESTLFSYHLTGSIFNTGWRGLYEWSAYAPLLGHLCVYRASFSGEKSL